MPQSEPNSVPPSALRRAVQDRMPEAIELLRTMVGINSWTRNPAGIERLAQTTSEAFAPLGFVPESVPSTIPGYGSHLFLVRRPSLATAPAIALVSHLDTVFPPEEEARNRFQWEVIGNRAYGPGSEDIKGGTVLIWLVLQAISAVHPEWLDRNPVVIGLNAAEEELSPDFGPELLRRLGPRPRAALIFEAEGRRGEFRRLVRARKGRGTFRIQAQGRSAHAGVDHARGVNAIAQLSHAILAAESISDPDAGLTVNVGHVEGGGGLNRVPQEAVASGEFRAFDRAAYSRGRSALLALSGPGTIRSRTDGFTASTKVSIDTETDPWPPNPGTDHLMEHWLSVARELGIPAEPEERGGLSDGNHLWSAVPTLDGLGPTGANAHCSERSADGTKEPEYVDLASIPDKALWNAVALLRLGCS